MTGQIIKMLGIGAGGTESSLAEIDVPADGDLVGVDWACTADLDADGDSAVFQLSFRSTYTDTNDDRGIISECRARYSLLTSGAANPHVNKYSNLPNLPVMAGERLYLHAAVTASTVSSFSALLHFNFTSMARVSMRRA